MKERIIGAVVLVVIAVLVVPVFLDGPPEESEVVSERVRLPGQSEQETQKIVLERDREEPVPVVSKPSAEKTAEPRDSNKAAAGPVPKPVAAAPETTQPEAKPPPVEPETSAKTPAQVSATGMWAVQLGSFSEQQNAERLAADLRKQGFAAFLSQLQTEAGRLHRVRVGPQKDRDSAEAMAKRLAKAGHKGQVVPHP